MEQIYQWFEYRKKTCRSFSLYPLKLSLKMIGWKQQEPETELSINPSVTKGIGTHIGYQERGAGPTPHPGFS